MVSTPLKNMKVSWDDYSHIWVCLIIIPMKNGYFIGNIHYFQTNPCGKIKNVPNHQPAILIHCSCEKSPHVETNTCGPMSLGPKQGGASPGENRWYHQGHFCGIPPHIFLDKPIFGYESSKPWYPGFLHQNSCYLWMFIHQKSGVS